MEIKHIHGFAPYAETLAAMEARVADIALGAADEAIWLLEHPPLYTAGTSSDVADLVDPNRFPVHVAGRGGQYTYHGPGQRVVYVMLDLNKRGRDVRKFVCALENWVIATLAEFNVKGERRAGRVGVWVVRADRMTATGANAGIKSPPSVLNCGAGCHFTEYRSMLNLICRISRGSSHVGSKIMA